MKKIKMLGIVAASALATQFVLFAAESNSPGILDIQNRIRFEYDDNIYETDTDKTDSFKIIEELELGITLDFQPTFITLRYRPSFSWWNDREPDDTDLHHDVDFVLNHEFSPRLSFGLKNVFRIAQQPEEIDRGTVVHEEDDYTYNVTDANIDYQVAQRTHAILGGRYTLLRYDNDDVSSTEDYDIWAGGLTVRQSLSEFAELLADIRAESVGYTDLESRDSDSLYAGLGYEQMLGASFVGTIRGGVQQKEYNDDAIDDDTQPYVDGNVTYIFSPKTRFSLGAGYSMFEADVYPFANQDRTIAYASVAHDLTARISFFLTGSYQLSEYNSDDIISEGADEVPEDYGGDETVTQLGLRIAYQVNARNSIELNYQHMDLSSDVRDDFDRNRASVGWRLDI